VGANCACGEVGKIIKLRGAVLHRKLGNRGGPDGGRTTGHGQVFLEKSQKTRVGKGGHLVQTGVGGRPGGQDGKKNGKSRGTSREGIGHHQSAKNSKTPQPGVGWSQKDRRHEQGNRDK